MFDFLTSDVRFKQFCHIFKEKDLCVEEKIHIIYKYVISKGGIFLKRKHMSFALIALIISIFTLSVKSASAEETTYKIGTDLTFAPFEFQNENNEYDRDYFPSILFHPHANQYSGIDNDIRKHSFHQNRCCRFC